MMKLNEQNESV